jgi:eukaryotic-like serine/threonine-protein kinase
MIETMSAAAVRPEWVGSFADDRFPLLRWLGGTENAGVFLTELSEPGQKAIIKLIPADAEDAEAREAAWTAAEALSHPNLMKVYTHGRCQIDDVPCLYVVTEFADEVLADVLSERPLTPQETRDMLGPALDALSYLHAKGLVHGRLNPSNIMAAGDRLKLSTYSVCPVGAAVISGPPRTVCDAPETENGSIEPASDIWSLGATLVEVLTKYPPLWNRERAADPTVPESMPEPFASIARKCLRSDPERRTTIEAIKARLEPARFPSRPQEKPATASPGKSRAAILLVAAALVLAGIGIWNALSHRQKPPQIFPSTAPEAQNLPAAAPAPAPAATPAVSTNPVATPVANPNASSAQAPASPDRTSPAPPSAAPAPIPASTPVPAAIPPSQPEAQVDQSPAPTSATVNHPVVNQILPDIIPSAMRTISGTVKVSVRLSVDTNGNVTDATLESPGPSKYFAGKSLEAARHWKFKPAQVGGNAAPSTWTLEFQFKRSGINVVPEQTTP